MKKFAALKVHRAAPLNNDAHAMRFREGVMQAADHSPLMPAARITFPHFSVSSAMSLPKSAGEPVSGVPPNSTRRALILASARAELISLFSLSTISPGVFL